jgi:SAM-dependent methyltransferase
MNFPDEVIAYLARHKHQATPVACAHQIARAIKQAGTLTRLFREHAPLSMLDIGCGLGLASIMLAREHILSDLHLLDGDGSGDIFHDYRAGAVPWNDVRLAGALARANLSAGCAVVEYPADPDLTISVDIIVSFKSWGTHYPISTYLPLAARSLKPGGLIAVDLHPSDRLHGEQASEIQAAGFDLVEQHQRRHVFQCR